MRYEDHLIDQIQMASDIVEVISQWIPLKKAGRNFKANCPFHEEKTASFMVQPEKQIFHCFGCGAGGNVFSFLMRYENSSFPEALRQLAERAHIELPKFSGKQADGPSIHERIYEIYRLASEYYHEAFLNEQHGKKARDYFLSRQFDLNLAKELRVGWASSEWQGLFNFLSKKGFSNEELLKSALIQRSAKGRFYDAFRARLLFPIYNLTGKAVAFGGRLLEGDDGPKYLNSPENPIFRKRRELYGLHLAKKFIDRENPKILVSEGYFDFARLYQMGFKFSVATLGTALTPDHVQVLKRFTEEAIVVYDGDKAGEAASLRGLEVFLEGGMNVKVIRLPQGFDPDDYLLKKGPDAFGVLVANAQDFFDYKLEIMLGRYNQSESSGLLKITNEFLETFLKVQNPILLDRFLRRLSASLGINEESLRSEFLKLKNKFSRQGKKWKEEEIESVATSSGNKSEFLLFSLMLEDKDVLSQALESLTEADFYQSSTKEFFRLISSMRASQQEVNWAQVLNRVSDESLKQNLTAVISYGWGPEERMKAFEDCLRTLKKGQHQKRLNILRGRIAKAEKEGNAGQLESFMREYQELLRM